MTLIIKNMSAQKIKTRCRAPSAPEVFFSICRKKFLSLSQKNKKKFSQKNGRYFVRIKRITPLPPVAALAALAVFFMPLQAKGEFKSAEQVSCPENTATGPISFPDEYALARAYDKGYCGITADKKTAKRWYIKAAKHGYMPAQYELGEKYFTGDGGTPDYPRAKRWYLAAAKQGHGLSQLRLGFLYAEAHFTGLKTDYAEAEKWFLKAAAQNAGDAQFRLGNFYHNYKDPPDLKKAAFWLTKAAAGGHRVAMFDLARLIRSEDPAQSLVWMKKAAELDLLPAQMTLSEMYAAGDGVPEDPAQSLAWTLKIAVKPTASPFWINRAGDIFFAGRETVPKDYLQAVKFYERAAAKDDPHALARLGQAYLEGLGVPADREKALQYLEKAAAQGSAEARALLKGQQDDTPSEK